MKILYIGQFDINLDKKGIFGSLISKLLYHGHSVVVCCADSKYEKTQIVESCGIKKVEIKVPNQFGANIIKKGLILIRLERVMKKAIDKYLSGDEFDLVLYATPPITLANVVKHCKKKYGCRSYLMLKDIFPQNAVDLHMMSKRGVTGLLYKFFRAKETKLYKYSDGIGCMSPANIEYLKAHNEGLEGKRIELFPNAVQVDDQVVPKKTSGKDLLLKYGISTDKLVFIYGGNLGKPQGLDFLAKGIKETCKNENVYFIIIGKGSEKNKLFEALNGVENVLTLEALPKEEYEKLCAQCDVGMVMLDKRFTIPNYPSRMLSYMQNAMPIFACTDKNTDVKQLIEEQAKCGKWCYSDDIEAFKTCVDWFVENRDKLEKMGENGYFYMTKHFNVKENVKKLEEFVSHKEEK